MIASGVPSAAGDTYWVSWSPRAIDPITKTGTARTWGSPDAAILPPFWGTACAGHRARGCEHNRKSLGEATPERQLPPRGVRVERRLVLTFPAQTPGGFGKRCRIVYWYGVA